nr:PREDICTED: autophagy-related protein 2 homolog B isoform X1 [Bemisia tabaci]
MPWFLPWSDSIKKRACRYLLQRYLGQFLEEKLTLDQLTVDLYNGTGSVSDVSLDVQTMNDWGEKRNLPVEFVDGHISAMSVSVPWSTLLKDSSYVEVTGLVITIQPKQRPENGVSMFESMWSSMTSSIQMAEECLREGGPEIDASQPVEGVEIIAQAIESILNRVKVKFIDTVIRLEHLPKESPTGIAVELRIKHLGYMDQAGSEPEMPPSSESLHQSAPAFSVKKFCLEGVSLYTDEFPASARTVSRSLISESPFSNKMAASFMESETSTYESAHSEDVSSKESAYVPNPILVGKLTGRQEVRLKLKQGEMVLEPKVDLEIDIGSATMFLSPRQFHLLLELMQGLASPDNQDCSNVAQRPRCVQKMMQASDFDRVEQELLRQLHPINISKEKTLQAVHGWSSAGLEDSEDEFEPMNNRWTATSSLPSSFNNSMSNAYINSSKSCGSTSSCSSSMSGPSTKWKGRSGSGDPDSNSSVNHFYIRLSSLAVIILHEDILTQCVESNALSQSSLKQMTALSESFFSKLGLFAVCGYGTKDFTNAKQTFSDACQLNHIRLLATTVILEGDEVTSVSKLDNFTLTAANLEVLECLYDGVVPNQKVEYVELLRFMKNSSENSLIAPLYSVDSSPDVKVQIKFSDHVKHNSVSCMDIKVSLQQCWSEVDISIVDRISVLLNPHPLCSKVSSVHENTTLFKNSSNNFLETSSYSNESELEWNVSIPYFVVLLRFPIPDLRSANDMDKPPWWQRRIRPDSMHLQLIDVNVRSHASTRQPASSYELQCRHINVLFQEDTNPLVPIAKFYMDDKSNDFTSSNIAKDLELLRIVARIYPAVPVSELEDDLSYMNEPASMAQSFYIKSDSSEPSLFSSQKVVRGNEGISNYSQESDELVIPASKEEMMEFIEDASHNAHIQIDATFPCANVCFPSKHLYEVVYNRLNTDLCLWTPSAPKQKKWNTLDSLNSINFSFCKSGLHYASNSESESESEDGVSYWVQKAEPVKKAKGQSEFTFTLNVGEGVFTVLPHNKDKNGAVIPGQNGKLEFLFKQGLVFFVSSYKGNVRDNYACVQAGTISLHHSSAVVPCSPASSSASSNSSTSLHLDPTIYQSCEELLKDSCSDMLAVAVSIKVNDSRVKTIRVACAISDATLRYRMCPTDNNWFNQLLDFFDVLSYPIMGYTPSQIVTELHIQFFNCAVDYRPLYLPYAALLSFGSFNLSSNIVARTSSSTLRFMAEEVALALTDKVSVTSGRTLNVKKDYICVVKLGLFELSLRKTENANSPKIDLRASNNIVHVRTCSDSACILLQLLSYIASDGDIATETPNFDSSSITEKTNESMVEEEQIVTESESLTSPAGNVHLMMEDAMMESNAVPETKSEEEAVITNGAGDIFLFPDENRSDNVSRSPSNWNDDDVEYGFCLLEQKACMDNLSRSSLPEVRTLNSAAIKIVDNHFNIPVGKTDVLKAPDHFPVPARRYTLKEMTVVWHMYGGSDFGDAKPSEKYVPINESVSCPTSPANRSGQINMDMDDVRFYKYNVKGTHHSSLEDVKPAESLPWEEQGGPQRQHHVLMELQLNKIRFQHEVYPDDTVEAKRQILLVKEVEIRDRLASSRINKFLYQYSSQARPRQSHADMVVIKAHYLRPDPQQPAEECCLKVSLLPLRLNIDQDSMLFLCSYINQLCGNINQDLDMSNASSELTPSSSISPPEDDDGSVSTSEESRKSEKFERNWSPQISSSPPVFFKKFIFSPEVPIRVDYEGKHVDMTHGPLAGLLLGLGNLNCSELALKRLIHRHGLLGFDKLIQYAITEWLQDIKKNQLPSIIGGVGPIHSVVQLFHGIRDLFWLPIEQYQKDGRIVRGLQRGANSFTTSTAIAALELTARVVQAIQSVAETAFDMLSPGPNLHKMYPRNDRRKKKRRHPYNNPADIREGVANALMLVREGMGEKAETLARAASEGRVLRQIPAMALTPIILASQATTNVLGGVRSQLVPDARKDAASKWRVQSPSM